MSRRVETDPIDAVRPPTVPRDGHLEDHPPPSELQQHIYRSVWIRHVLEAVQRHHHIEAAVKLGRDRA
jgi:hypothetical protein